MYTEYKTTDFVKRSFSTEKGRGNGEVLEDGSKQLVDACFSRSITARLVNVKGYFFLSSSSPLFTRCLLPIRNDEVVASSSTCVAFDLVGPCRPLCLEE